MPAVKHVMRVYGVVITAYVACLSPVWRESPTPEAAPPMPARLGSELLQRNNGGVMSQWRGTPAHVGFERGAHPSTTLTHGWTQPLPNMGIHDAAKSSPAVDASGIYVGTDSGWLMAFSWEGSVRWRFLAQDSARGIHATPALDENSVYVGAYNGFLYRLDKATGRPIWAVKLGDALGASPVLLDGGDLLQTVETASPSNAYVTRLRAADGTQVWRTRLLGEQSHSTATVSPSEGMLYLGVNNRTVQAFHLHDGTEAWSVSVGGQVKSTLLLSDATLFVSSFARSLDALDARTGALRWSTPTDEGTTGSPALAPLEQRVVLVTGKGTVMAVDAATGTPAWQIPSREEARSRPKVRGSPVITSSGQGGASVAWLECQPEMLCSVDVKTGEVLGRHALPGKLTSTPAVRDDVVVVSTFTQGALTLFNSVK